MALGKSVRLNRLFANPSGRFCSVAVDHFIGYAAGLPEGLADLPKIIDELAAGRPDAITMHKGPAMGCWIKHAGKLPLILQSSIIRPDDVVAERSAEVDEALRLGADAFALAAFVHGPTEGVYLRRVSEVVRQAAAWDMPVILHAYPRAYKPDGKVEISFRPEDIAWAVRCAFELGVDVVKTPYTGGVKTFAGIVSSCPVPVVAAGGPKTKTFREALDLAAGAIAAGAKGLTIGRNIWGHREPVKALRAFQAVVHERLDPDEAMRRAGIEG